MIKRGPHNPLTLEERLCIHEKHEACVDKDTIAAEFGVTRKTINLVLRNSVPDDVLFSWEAAKKKDPVQLDTRTFVPYNERENVKRAKAARIEVYTQKIDD